LDGFKPSAPTYPLVEMQIPISEDTNPEPYLEAPKSVENKKPLPVYAFPVVHDHFIGSCRGTLKVTHKAISYIAENEKCSFSLNYDEFDFSLDGDRLKIKTESKNYHFKPVHSSSEDETQSQLETILKNITRSKS